MTITSSMWVLYIWETICRKLWLFGTQEANGLLSTPINVVLVKLLATIQQHHHHLVKLLDQKEINCTDLHNLMDMKLMTQSV